MNKDIIYIDTEDDITAIIGKIKSSHEKIVALVPPKRTGVLQSAVNLRLLSRMAKQNGKSIVLITNDKALFALSATAKIPVAKNLQSKPEVAEIAALEVDDGEDVIDGSQLPIGELVKTTDYKHGDDVSDDISSINIDDEGPEYVTMAKKDSTKPLPIKTPPKNNVKVPNFLKFRKKLFLGIAAAILFIVFLVWAIWFAPAAEVVITAKTEAAPVSIAVNLGGTAATDVSKNIIQTVVKQLKKDISVDFTATGKKDLGEKATGTIKITNCDSPDPFTLGIGTVFVADSGERFVNTAPVTVPGLSGSAAACQNNGTGAGTANVTVVAEQSGTSYNIAASDYSITGVGGFVYAHGGAMTGGSTRMATVVTALDVQKASQALVDLSSDATKQQLKKQFVNGEVVIGDSFTIDRAAAISAPVVGAEATGGKATLTSATTFSITAIAKSELKVFLRNSLNKQIGNDQRIYMDGIDKIVLSGYLKNDQGSSVNIAAVGQIGPNINKDAVKKQVKGKHYGDVQALLEGVKGVVSVDVKFSYFWVTTVPDDINKIEVEFVLTDA